MNSKKLKIILAVGLLYITQACNEFVDVVPDNIAVIEDAFATRQSAERFLSSLYGRNQTMLPSGGVVDPFINPSDPSVGATDEIWINDIKRIPRGSSEITIGRLLAGGQNVFTPLFDAWGGTGRNNLFIGIRDCNIFLENIDLPFDLPEEEKKLWIAEAKFMKAYFHFTLMRMYGPIPIGRENIEVASGLDAVRVKRDPVDEVADYIVELLDEVIAVLPGATANLEEEAGRANGVMAAVLKARTLMLVASPLFNGNTDYAGFQNVDGEQLISANFDAGKWERTEAACLQAIEIAHQAGHALYTTVAPQASWSDTTRIKMDIRGSVTEIWNNELLWPNTNENTSALQAASRPRLAPRAALNKTTPAFWAPTMRVAEMFYSSNGVPINEDLSYDYNGRFNVVDNVGPEHKHYVGTGFDAPGINLNREPRFYASLGFDGGVWLEDQESGQLDEDLAYVVRAKSGEFSAFNGPGGFTFSATGYFAKKLSHPENFQGTGEVSFQPKRYPFPIARLADLYLLYAEALNENGKTSEAHIWIDQVRARAGLQGVAQSWANNSSRPAKPSTVEGFREIVQQERMIELVFEGQRFWDLRRWKRAQDFLNTDIKGWNIAGVDTEEYYRVTTIASLRFLNRDYLWPISEGDIIRNPNLVQNPGW